jgi:hypothetical protein
MSAKVAFLSRAVSREDNTPRTAVPASAVTERNGRKVVFLVRDGKATETAVQVGAPAGDLVPVSGVQPGDKVVLKPSDRVRDSGPVSTASK